MCDTFVALGHMTTDGAVLLAKNADTEVNEAQDCVRLPRRDWPAGTQVRTTHKVIAQAPTTWEVILDKSFWTYGAEIGFNEHGLAIGNEAVFTNQVGTRDGVMLIDHLRLMLERARTCDEAIDVIAGLLAEHGQWGNCELRGNSHYDGGFLIADRAGAIELQTAGEHWAVRHVRDVAVVSNVHGIRTDWDRASFETEDRAAGVKRDFRATYTNEARTWCAGADERAAASAAFLEARRGRIDVRTMFDLLRDVGEVVDGGAYHPMRGGDRPTRICMHAAPFENRLWQATGSMVTVAYPDGRGMGWTTATSGPDVSIFKPVFCGVPLPDLGPMPREIDTPGAYWWKWERLHRRVMADYAAVQPDLRAEFEALEARFLADADGVMRGTTAEQHAFEHECWRLADEAAGRWLVRLEAKQWFVADAAYGAMWERFNSQAALGLQ